MNYEKCGKPCELRPNMFHWHGQSFTGWYCPDCNALWENKDDSLFAYIHGLQGASEQKYGQLLTFIKRYYELADFDQDTKDQIDLDVRNWLRTQSLSL